MATFTPSGAMATASATQPRILGFTRNVFVLAWVSMLTDVSSEMTLTILPLFLSNVLGVRPALIGVIEGIADSTGTLLRILSGWLSDRLARRKGLAVVGYGLSSVAKPFLYFANSWGVVLALRFTDRVGKGIRASPRDALIADSCGPGERGKSFGFHRAMDSAGAVVGLGIATVIVWLTQRGDLALARETYQSLVLVGIVPAFLAVLLLLLFVREPARASVPHLAEKVRDSGKAPSSRPSLSLRSFDLRFKFFLGIIVAFTLGNSSDAFLILRAQNLGLSVLEIFVMLVLFNVIYTLVSYPAGALSDALGRERLIVAGWLVYGAIYLGFALSGAAWQVFVLYVLYGLYYGIFEGVARAYVADLVPQEQRGTAYGLFNTAVGITALPASVIAGVLWQLFSPSAPFLFGALLAVVAAVALVAAPRLSRGSAHASQSR